MNPIDIRTADFTSARPLLFSIAYRMLGSVADAEDVVQDAYLRWLEAPEADVRAPRAYLICHDGQRHRRRAHLDARP